MSSQRTSPEHRSRRGDQSVASTIEEHPAVRWLMLDGGRPTIVAGVSVGSFLLLVGLGSAGVVGVADASLVTSALTAAITGVFTLVSITISINQLVLSRILGSPQHIRERIESVHRYRTRVEEMAPEVSVSPTDPSAFLSVLTGVLRDRTDELASAYDERHDTRLVEDVEALVDTLRSLADGIEHGGGSRRLDLFSILSSILNDSYSKHLYTVHRIKADSSDLAEDERRALDAVSSVLDEINLTRHYFKTLYIHEELASVSRLMLVTGLPALVVCFAMILAYADGFASAVSEPVRLVAVSAAIAAVIAPLAVLFSYGLRLATVASRTTTFGTFTPVEEMP